MRIGRIGRAAVERTLEAGRWFTATGPSTVDGFAMASHFYWLIIGILVVWRLTHLFYGEDGPWNLLVRFRQAVGNGFWGSLLDCFYCLSLWVAFPFAYLLAQSWKERLLLWPALSAGAILLERLTSNLQPHSTLDYREDEESDHVLRQQPSAIEDHDTYPAAK